MKGYHAHVKRTTAAETMECRVVLTSAGLEEGRRHRMFEGSAASGGSVDAAGGLQVRCALSEAGGSWAALEGTREGSSAL